MRGGRFLAEMRGAFDVTPAEVAKRTMRRMGGTATLGQMLAAKLRETQPATQKIQ
jgi:uncharacterized protein YunC (DUF1805 family)